MTDDDLRAYFRDRLQERAELLAVHAWLSRQATVTDGEIKQGGRGGHLRGGSDLRRDATS